MIPAKAIRRIKIPGNLTVAKFLRTTHSAAGEPGTRRFAAAFPTAHLNLMKYRTASLCCGNQIPYRVSREAPQSHSCGCAGEQWSPLPLHRGCYWKVTA